jgi:hypothetical protein
MFETNYGEKLETQVLSNFFFEIYVFYEIMLKNIVERGKPLMTIWRRRIACWIPRATNTHVV